MTRITLLLAVVLLVSGCIPPPKPEPASLYESYRVSYKPPRDPSAVRVKVSLGEQRVYLLEGSRVLMAMPVTVGRADTPTPQGEFRITRKIARHRSATHGFAVRGKTINPAKRNQVSGGARFVGFPLPYWCEIAPGVGFHTGWLRHQPASNGTIRMHRNVAPVFFDLVRVGTPVSIAYAHPEDEKHAFIPLPPDSGPLPPQPNEFYLGDAFYGP